MKKKMKFFIKNVGYGIFITIHILVVWISFHPQFCLKPDVIEEIFHTGVQIVAGLYGTILTGYVFLLGKIDSQVAVNVSLFLLCIF